MYIHIHICLFIVYNLPLSCRCLSWEACDRPSISAILTQLYSLLSPETGLLPGSTNDDDVSFDHTDSLGHVVVEVEFDETDLDSNLMEFLLANQVLLTHNIVKQHIIHTVL